MKDELLRRELGRRAPYGTAGTMIAKDHRLTVDAGRLASSRHGPAFAQRLAVVAQAHHIIFQQR
ncbi:MAG: hypothetical protein KGZ70_12365 [Hydrogenophaga sp.]|nr:hypothetical protein [Hydrogenophaga sp.]